MGAISRAAEQGISVHSEYRTHGRALAHPHQDWPSSDPRTNVAERLAGNESKGCNRSEPEAARQCHAGVAARTRAKSRVADHRDHRAWTGVHALPLRGDQRQSGYAERI